MYTIICNVFIIDQIKFKLLLKMIYITKLEAKNAYVLLSTVLYESSIIWTTLIKEELTLRRYLRRNGLHELEVGEDRVHGVS